jgi:flagellar hook-length control protein FliK
VPVAESETGIPVAKVASAGDSDTKAESKPAAAVKDGIELEIRSAASRSTARFVVAKAGVANSEAPASSITTDQSAVDSEVDAVPKVLDGDQSAAHKESARMSLRNAGTPALQADGTRPVSAELPQSGPVAIDRTVPSNGAEVARTEADHTTPSERTTVKTIAIDTVKGVRYLLTKGEQTMRIRLVPESLGELRLVVTSSGDEITVRLASANHGVRELLHTQVQHLREVLAQDGTPVGKITITGDMSAGTGNGNLLSGSPDRGMTPHTRGWTGNMAGSPNQTPTNGQQPGAAPRMSVTHAGTLNLFA